MANRMLAPTGTARCKKIVYCFCYSTRGDLCELFGVRTVLFIRLLRFDHQKMKGLNSTKCRAKLPGIFVFEKHLTIKFANFAILVVSLIATLRSCELEIG